MNKSCAIIPTAASTGFTALCVPAHKTLLQGSPNFCSLRFSHLPQWCLRSMCLAYFVGFVLRLWRPSARRRTFFTPINASTSSSRDDELRLPEATQGVDPAVLVSACDLRAMLSYGRSLHHLRHLPPYHHCESGLPSQLPLQSGPCRHS